MHDGNLLKVESLYYWYAMSYGPYREGKTGCSNQSSTSAGFRNDNKVSIYSSPDLMKWSKIST